MVEGFPFGVHRHKWTLYSLKKSEKSLLLRILWYMVGSTLQR